MTQQKTVSFRIDAEKVEALDKIAVHTQRDRTFLLNEAIDAWLDLNEYHRRLIEDGMLAASEGRVVESSEMRRRLEHLKGRKTG